MSVAPQYESFSYQRRVPEQTLLYQVLAENIETFLDRTRIEEHELPKHVEKELREYLTCGILARGFDDHFIRGKAKMETRVSLALTVLLAMAPGRIRANQADLMRSLTKPIRKTCS